MDWSVAPQDHDLTLEDLRLQRDECWQIVRDPIRFIVFSDFEMPMLLGMPLMSTMTQALQWPRGKPAYVELCSNAVPHSGELPPARVWKLPLRVLRTVTPDALVVCCAEEGQWIRSD